MNHTCVNYILVYLNFLLSAQFVPLCLVSNLLLLLLLELATNATCICMEHADNNNPGAWELQNCSGTRTRMYTYVHLTLTFLAVQG